MKLTSEAFGSTPDGTDVTLYTITNSAGATVRFIDWGATVTEVCVPDRDGNNENVNLGFDDLAGYIDNPPFFGAIIGRFGNRIGDGQFSIDSETYHLAKNNGPHHLHGGLKGFSHQLWQGTPFEEADKAGVTFELISPDGDEGYPGELNVKVTYTFTEDCELRIDYEATVTGKPTVVNLTNHCYWNLNGAGNGNVHDHQLQLSADRYLEVDEHTLPTGNLLDVAETAFDFTIPKTLGEHISRYRRRLRSLLRVERIRCGDSVCRPHQFASNRSRDGSPHHRTGHSALHRQLSRWFVRYGGLRQT